MIFCTHHHNHSLQIYQHCVMVTSGCSFLLNPENAKRDVLCQKEPFWEPCEFQKRFLRCCLLRSKVVEMMWHGFDIFMICTDIPNHPYKELGRDAEREKMWHESVRGLESGRETRLVRMWSERSEYEMRRWDGETDRETKSAIPTLSDLGCEYVDQGLPEWVTPHFCLALYLHRQANAFVCRQTEVFAPPLLEWFTTISIFGVVQMMTTWWKECRELIGLCRSLKRRHRPIGSALIGLPRRSDQRWSADYRRNIGRWSISKESCNISQGWMGSPS